MAQVESFIEPLLVYLLHKTPKGRICKKEVSGIYGYVKDPFDFQRISQTCSLLIENKFLPNTVALTREGCFSNSHNVPLLLSLLSSSVKEIVAQPLLISSTNSDVLVAVELTAESSILFNDFLFGDTAKCIKFLSITSLRLIGGVVVLNGVASLEKRLALLKLLVLN
ncbi:hypothetical protein GQX74_011495 [Glossina fuscipes]|nr:hypothetical protein GQX74_011495 [Glossina fuscipes]